MNQDKAGKRFTRGGHLSFHDLRMFFQVNKTLVQIHFFIMVLLMGGVMWCTTSSEQLKGTAAFHFSKVMTQIGAKNKINVPVQGRVYSLPVQTIASHPYFKATAGLVKAQMMHAFLESIALTFALYIGFCVYLARKGKNKAKDVFIRGSSLADSSEVKKLIINNNEASPLMLDNLPLILNAEVQHFLIHGTLGMGKSQLIMKLLDQLRARGDRVIMYDKGCSFTSVYYDETQDVLLNPYDERCANWDLWREAPKESDLKNLAESLIPVEGESQPFFVHAARSVVCGSASKMRHEPDCSLEKLLQFLLTGEFSQMEPYLAGTSAATLMSDKVEKMAISVRAMITTYVQSLQALAGLEKSGKDPFCIRDYILDENASGWLFISSNGAKHGSLKPLISMWLSIASLTLLSLPENLDRRIWFICDELPSLHQLPFLGATLAEVRKFGGCFILGMQNYFQLAQVYGDLGAKAIFDLLNTRFFFRSPSPDMAKRVSIELCNEELDEVKESTSYGANSIRDGVSLSRNRTSRALVDYSEIMRLKILSCFVRLPGDYPITKLQLKLNKRPEKTKGFIERDVPEFKSTQAPLPEKNSSGATQGVSDSENGLKKKNMLVEFDL